MPTAKGWTRESDEPIPLPDGGELRKLLDAGHYVDKLPRSMQEREEWQAVMEVLLSAVEGREPVRLAQVALTLALQESKPMKGARRKPVKNDESFDSHRLEVRGVDVGFAVGAPAPAKIVYHEADVLMVAAGDFREMHHARRSRH